MAVIGGNAPPAAGQRGPRVDPRGGFNFLVEIQGLIVGGFTNISGLRITTEATSFREGGVNTHEYRLPGATSYSDLVFRRGVSDGDLLWGWYQDVIKGKIIRRNGTIHLLDNVRNSVKWWNFYRAYPIAWEGPEFDAQANQVLFQTLTLAHEGLSHAMGS